MSGLRVLSVASECAPLVKTGGLADVVGALPGALAPEGIDMAVLLPGYPAVLKAVKARKCADLPDLLGGPARLLSSRHAGLSLYILDAPHLYDRPGSIYLGPDGTDWPDNPERFAALSQAAAVMAQGAVAGWVPQVLHLHDWQAGLVPEYLPRDGNSTRPGTVITIHNMAFHGFADAGKVAALGLDPWRMTPDGYEAWGRISALKAGLTGADRITTVSPTYAAELATQAFGMGMEGVIRARRDVVSGILNGIDEDVWNPATDPHIRTFKNPAGKKAARKALQDELGLPQAQGPLCVVISRLTGQKGLDLLLDALPGLLEQGGQLALLGSGEPGLEAAFRNAARDDNVAVHIGYDEALSHRLIAGGDAILVPSRFEPCGLTQLYGLRYGTIPLVALTGGLADTVINASPAAQAMGVATGVQFSPIDLVSLQTAVARLCALYADERAWLKLQRNAMKQPVGWGPSARAYAALYRELV